MTEAKGVERRRMQLLDDLRNRRRYWELKEEVEDQKIWKRQLSHEHKEQMKNRGFQPKLWHSSAAEIDFKMTIHQ